MGSYRVYRRGFGFRVKGLGEVVLDTDQRLGRLE